MSRVVISDTSPLRYLILIDQIKLLPALYTEVLVPQTVADELLHPSTPAPVRRWIESAPDWLRIMGVTARPVSDPIAELDRGERDAIFREGVEAARRLGLLVTGTLGVLDRAAEQGLIDLAVAIDRLRQTNFRIDPAILDRLLANAEEIDSPTQLSSQPLTASDTEPRPKEAVSE